MKFIIIDVLYIEDNCLISSTKSNITLYKIPDRNYYKDYNSDFIDTLGKKLSEGYSSIKLMTIGEDIPDIIIIDISDNTLAKMKLLYGIYGDILEIDKLGINCFDILYRDYLFNDKRYNNIVNNIKISNTYKKIIEAKRKAKTVKGLINEINEINCNYLYNDTLKRFALEYINHNNSVSMTMQIGKYLPTEYSCYREKILYADNIALDMGHTIVRIIALTEFCEKYFNNQCIND